MTAQRNIPSGLVALKRIVEGTANDTGQKFFESLVCNLAEVLDVHGVWVTEFLEKQYRLRALAFWLDGKFVDEYEYDVQNTPCEPVLQQEEICHIPDRVIDLYPKDPDLKKLGGVSYMGLALKDTDGKILGHLALLDNKPMEEIPEAFAIFRIFAARAAAELRRVRSEKQVMETASKLSRLLNGSADAILEFDANERLTQANQAAKTLFQIGDHATHHKCMEDFFDTQSYERIKAAIKQKDRKHPSSYWIRGQLNGITSSKEVFPAEVTFSAYVYEGVYYTALFVRNIQEHVLAQQTLKTLRVQTTMLQEEVDAHSFGDIIGKSPVILKALEQVQQVAPTHATVLLLGATGTGKELFAKAIHKASARKDKPLVALNCAALPAELIESELFGHVKGAYTGATFSREGRFAMADQGTIFLDEIGELPMPLQAKLLRVLQEGEFEMLGSSVTQKVDVRVIAATNRDLRKEVDKGRFREDLYYRLNVFPIEIPALCERGEDIILIAEAFIKKFALQKGIRPKPLDEINKQMLMAYPWPGNVRELQNIVERAVIICKEGYIDFRPLLTLSNNNISQHTSNFSRVLTETEMKEMEKQNIIKALEITNGKISGKNGAAALLQIPFTTLNSRMAKLGIKK